MPTRFDMYNMVLFLSETDGSREDIIKLSELLERFYGAN